MTDPDLRAEIAQLRQEIAALRYQLSAILRRPTQHPVHPGCGVCALGFCRVHYTRWKRTGTTYLRNRKGQP